MVEEVRGGGVVAGVGKDAEHVERLVHRTDVDKVGLQVLSPDVLHRKAHARRAHRAERPPAVQRQLRLVEREHPVQEPLPRPAQPARQPARAAEGRRAAARAPPEGGRACSGVMCWYSSSGQQAWRTPSQSTSSYGSR